MNLFVSTRTILLSLAFALTFLPVISVSASEPLLVLSYHDVRDDVPPKGSADAYAVSTQNFISHLDWLRANGYQPISLTQLIEASQGKAALPDKPVLLTFDDGLRSMYTRVFPILRAYGYPGVAALITAWVDLPTGTSIDFGPRAYTHDDFLTWAQAREMQASGLIELASHTNDSHKGVLANPQGSMRPAVVTRQYARNSGQYESASEYTNRLRADLNKSRALILKHTGHAPRAVVWPYAAYNEIANEIADDLGMNITFDLEGQRTTFSSDLHGLARLLMQGNPTVTDLAYELRKPPANESMRAMQIDLDAVYDQDPIQQQRNLDALIQRVKDIGPSHVFLQAFADPDGNGSADAVYFPNRHLPMRADLFSFVAWQLKTRSGVTVYAWMPTLGFEFPPGDLGYVPIESRSKDEIPRLDFTRPQVARAIREIYEDLAINSAFTGILFHDDAYLRETELPALADGSTVGRTQALIDFTLELQHAAERYRPKLKTARNLYATTLLQPESQVWFAQRLDQFNEKYDYTALMAMPWMEGSRNAVSWLDTLVESVRVHDPAFTKTIFELQTLNWRTRESIPSKVLAAQSRRLAAAGIKNIAWYPDDFIRGVPSRDEATEIMSARSSPYRQK